MVTWNEAAEPKPKPLARVTWQLVPSLLEDVVERLEEKPQTRSTIVDALCLAVALVDIQSCRGVWDRAARRAAERLATIGDLLDIEVARPKIFGEQEPWPGYLGTAGARDEGEAYDLAESITGYLHVDLAMANLPGFGYGAVIVDTLLLVAAVIFLAMMVQPSLPREERSIECYQVALWRAYARLYGTYRNEEVCRHEHYLA